MSDCSDYSKEYLVCKYLKAEKRRMESKSGWFLLGGILCGVIGSLLLSKIGINKFWAIVPGYVVGVLGLVRMFAEKLECEEALNRVRYFANLSREEFYQLQDDLDR